jgi:hypothetical protein
VYGYQDQPGDHYEYREDQVSEGLARELSFRPRVSVIAEATAGYLGMRADASIVPTPPGLGYAEGIAEARWRNPILVESASLPFGPGTLVGVFSWTGDVTQSAAPLTEEAGTGIPLNGAYAESSLSIGVLDQSCEFVPETVTLQIDKSCSGALESLGPCAGDVEADYLFTVELPFLFGQPFYLAAAAFLNAKVANQDRSLVDEFFGAAESDFLHTGRWMGIQEVRNFAGMPVDDYSVTDLGPGGIDWTQPVPIPVPEPAQPALLLAGSVLLWLPRLRLWREPRARAPGAAFPARRGRGRGGAARARRSRGGGTRGS